VVVVVVVVVIIAAIFANNQIHLVMIVDVHNVCLILHVLEEEPKVLKELPEEELVQEEQERKVPKEQRDPKVQRVVPQEHRVQQELV
jgi:flagellar biogenesis protein FliO